MTPPHRSHRPGQQHRRRDAVRARILELDEKASGCSRADHWRGRQGSARATSAEEARAHEPEHAHGDHGARTPQIDDRAAAAAPVVIDGEELFRVRGTAAVPAEARTGVIVERIQADIMIGDQRIVSVFEGDAAVEGIQRDIFAKSVAARRRAAVERSPTPWPVTR